MQIRQELVTPELAESYMKMNTFNRPLNVRRIAAIVNAMDRGEWVDNGDAIRFSKTGALLDGQHRLAAIIKTGVAQNYVVISDLDDDVFTTIDTGKPRNTSDVFAISGIRNYTTAAAITRAFLSWQKMGNPFDMPPERRPSNDEVLTAYQNDARFEKATSFIVGHKWLRNYMSASICGFVYLSALHADEESEMTSFLTEMNEPSPTPKSNVPRLLREKLIENRASVRRLNAETVLALVIRSYKSYREGKTLKLLRTPTNFENDAFTL